MKKLLFIQIMWCLLMASTTFAFNRQDSLRGSNGRGRSWWDVQHYALSIAFDTATKSISGSNVIIAKIIAAPSDSLQLDLQEPMILDSVKVNNTQLDFSKEENVWWIKYPFHQLVVDQNFELSAYYHGSPRIAINPPWDGGFIWTKDSLGNPWIAVACQGLGASSWWPCKDDQSDEPDSGMEISMKSQKSYDPLINDFVSNGMRRVIHQKTFKNSEENPVAYENPYVFMVTDSIINPINSYDATFYIGDYVHWTDTLMGEKGKLDLSFYALKYHEAQAREQFKVVKQMLHCYEYWMGPYPFYEDGYKLVEAPYLGMEHQSAIAYGNKYRMGYLGSDRSGTGVGLLFDYIIIHESGHEWFGNNITAKDEADNWLHEGFTTYVESLFVECAFGKEKAETFNKGEWKNIQNDKPIIGEYGVHDEGSNDKYDKGAALIHTIRVIMNDDEQFRQLLRGLNKTFYHQTVTSAQVEKYINDFTHYNFTPIFDQYLRTTKIPKLEWYIKKKQLYYRFDDVVDGFSLPMKISARKRKADLNITGNWQSIKWKRGFGIHFSNEFLIKQE